MCTGYGAITVNVISNYGIVVGCANEEDFSLLKIMSKLFITVFPSSK